MSGTPFPDALYSIFALTTIDYNVGIPYINRNIQKLNNRKSKQKNQIESLRIWLTLAKIKCILGANKAQGGNIMKANVNIPEDVLQKTDKKAKALGISRSAFITMTLSEKLMQTDLMDSLPQMLETLKSFKENEKQ